MPRSTLALVFLFGLVSYGTAKEAGNRLAYLDGPCDPYYVGRDTAKLITPQWIGEEGVEAVIVLAINDLGDPVQYEAFLRPIFERLKKIDGRAGEHHDHQGESPPPALEEMVRRGSEPWAHTIDHPCPCLGKGDFRKAKATYDDCVDRLKQEIPEARTVAFRMPCCDSMNSASPRFYAEIFARTTPAGKFLEMDSSVFQVFTADDPALPREIVQEGDSRPRFAKYLPKEREFVNYVENYPYPYVIDRLCWEMPSPSPDDWQGNNLNRPRSPITIRDMKAAIDATVIKQGTFTLTFHPHMHNWITKEQVVGLIDHVVAKHGKKVKFLNFREVYERLTKNLLGGHPLRTANGQDNGVRWSTSTATGSWTW